MEDSVKNLLDAEKLAEIIISEANAQK